MSDIINKIKKYKFIDPGVKKYAKMQMQQYAHGTSNHGEHNGNADYWDILLADIKNKDLWHNKKALDFGCGKGRNVTNLLSLANWLTVDGVDISVGNISHCEKTYPDQKSNWYTNNGLDLEKLKTGNYDFVMSTITFQHIPVHEIRKNILKEIFRVMRPKGIFSFQMGYGPIEEGVENPASYYDNIYLASCTNSVFDIRVDDESIVVKELSEIGFINVTTILRQSYSDKQHPQWIYIRCEKAN